MKHVGFDKIGHEGAERVVVAEPYFVGRNGIVLVDDGNDAQAEERAQRGACVQVALAVCHVFMGKQNLRRDESVLAKAGLIGLDQAHLTDGRRGLQLVNRARPLLPAQPLHAFGDRAARYENHLAAQASSSAICFTQRVSAP